MTNRVICWVVFCATCFAFSACGSATPETTQPAAIPAAAAAPTPLKASAYKVEWLSHKVPSEMEAAKEYSVPVTLRNMGDGIWPSKGGPSDVLISYHWLPGQGDKAVVPEGARTPLPHDIAPGETFTVNNVKVVSPKEPGSYRLQLTLVHERVVWFETAKAATLIVPVTVR